MNRTITKRLQGILGVGQDGIIGKQTMSAAARYAGDDAPALWPSKSQVRSGESIFGVAGKVPLKRIKPPYTLYYAGKAVPAISVHERVEVAVMTALQRVFMHYGAARVHDLGLDVYDGCYNNRSVRGGSATSMHAWAIALDFGAAHNGNRTRGSQARFAAPEYDFWWLAWMSVGARPFGLHNDRDYMHVEFVR